MDGWKKVFDFFGRHLYRLTGGEPAMCTYVTETFDCDGAGKGASGWFTAPRGPPSTLTTRTTLTHEHTVNIDFVNPAEGPSARVALELTEESALALVDAIHKALAAAPPGIASAKRR